mgnify:CR=1 FL=1
MIAKPHPRACRFGFAAALEVAPQATLITVGAADDQAGVAAQVDRRAVGVADWVYGVNIRHARSNADACHLRALGFFAFFACVAWRRDGGADRWAWGGGHQCWCPVALCSCQAESEGGACQGDDGAPLAPLGGVSHLHAFIFARHTPPLFSIPPFFACFDREFFCSPHLLADLQVWLFVCLSTCASEDLKICPLGHLRTWRSGHRHVGVLADRAVWLHGDLNI